ncbi:MAG: ATP synthase F1 subunit delta [Dehalococcoidia bacterium]|nr:ATP synthase F1 subunit delta [Dehalococcoidia bacterium]
MAIDIQAKDLAKGLFDAGMRDKQPSRWLGEMRRVADLTMDDALMAKMKRDGSVAEKSLLLSERAGGLSPDVLGVAAHLIEKGNLGEFPYIAIEYQHCLDAHYGVSGAEVAEVTTAIALDDEYKLVLGKKLGDIIGRPVVIKAKVDPSIVGGIRIRVGDKLIDGSLRHKLDMLSKELL